MVDEIKVGEVISEQAVETPKCMPRGMVYNCSKLNVRRTPDLKSEVLCVINDDEEVELDKQNSTNEFYKVITADGVEGYCMRKYIKPILNQAMLIIQLDD